MAESLSASPPFPAGFQVESKSQQDMALQNHGEQMLTHDMAFDEQTNEHHGLVEGPESQSEEPSIDIMINNVVCTFNTRCHLNLKKVAMEGANVIFRRENGVGIFVIFIFTI